MRWSPRRAAGGSAAYAAAASSVGAAAPRTRTWRSPQRKTASHRGSAASARPFSESQKVPNVTPSSAMSWQSTVRADGPPVAEVVASTIARACASPPCSAAATQRRKRVNGFDGSVRRSSISGQGRRRWLWQLTLCRAASWTR